MSTLALPVLDELRIISTHASILVVREEAVCKDGFSMSVQASETHYCSPRRNGLKLSQYESVEVGFPSAPEPLLDEFGDDGGVYGWVPVQVVLQIIQKHGGLDLEHFHGDVEVL